MTRTIAREVRRHRDRRGMSAQQLADRTAELGMPIPRPDLANLESGRRDSVSAAEVLILAAALDVAPIDLIAPVGYDEHIEMLPGRMMDPLEAARWVGGQHAIDLSGPEPGFRPYDAGETSSLTLTVNYGLVLNEFAELEARAARSARDYDLARTTFDGTEALLDTARSTGSSAEFIDRMEEQYRHHRLRMDAAKDDYEYRTAQLERYRVAAVSMLRPIRAEMRSRGMLPPRLPSSLKDPDADGGSA